MSREVHGTGHVKWLFICAQRAYQPEQVFDEVYITQQGPRIT